MLVRQGTKHIEYCHLKLLTEGLNLDGIRFGATDPRTTSCEKGLLGLQDECMSCRICVTEVTCNGEFVRLNASLERNALHHSAAEMPTLKVRLSV